MRFKNSMRGFSAAEFTVSVFLIVLLGLCGHHAYTELVRNEEIRTHRSSIVQERNCVVEGMSKGHPHTYSCGLPNKGERIPASIITQQAIDRYDAQQRLQSSFDKYSKAGNN